MSVAPHIRGRVFPLHRQALDRVTVDLASGYSVSALLSVGGISLDSEVAQQIPVPGERFRGDVVTGVHVERDSYMVWGMEVINEDAPDHRKVIIRDDSRDFADLMDECRRAVEVARGTWFYSLRPKDVRRKGEKK